MVKALSSTGRQAIHEAVVKAERQTTAGLGAFWRFVLFFLLLSLGAKAETATLHLPELTGQVVDNAHILSEQVIAGLDKKLAEYEVETTNQVVVITLPSLEGDSIEDYGYKLARQWGIGQQGMHNGVLLIAVPSEHKARIEVGRGLKGTLTNKLTSQITQDIIAPAFR